VHRRIKSIGASKVAAQGPQNHRTPASADRHRYCECGAGGTVSLAEGDLMFALTDLEICTIGLCATIVLCTIGLDLVTQIGYRPNDPVIAPGSIFLGHPITM
jgi:hypothetical protein